jgi:hypothetical protein
VVCGGGGGLRGEYCIFRRFLELFYVRYSEALWSGGIGVWGGYSTVVDFWLLSWTDFFLFGFNLKFAYHV